MADLWVKHNGVWKIPTAVWTKDNGEWRSSNAVHRNVGGVWQQVWPVGYLGQPYAIHAGCNGNGRAMSGLTFTLLHKDDDDIGDGSPYVMYDDPDGVLLSIANLSGTNKSGWQAASVYDKGYPAGSHMIYTAAGRINVNGGTGRFLAFTDAAGNSYARTYQVVQGNTFTTTAIFTCTLTNAVTAGQSLNVNHNGGEPAHPIASGLFHAPLPGETNFASDFYNPGSAVSSYTRTVAKSDGSGNFSSTIILNDGSRLSSILLSFGEP